LEIPLKGEDESSTSSPPLEAMDKSMKEEKMRGRRRREGAWNFVPQMRYEIQSAHT